MERLKSYKISMRSIDLQLSVAEKNLLPIAGESIFNCDLLRKMQRSKRKIVQLIIIIYLNGVFLRLCELISTFKIFLILGGFIFFQDFSLVFPT